ncbi:MAG: TerC/Alx family metal homeostasis membrane protein [Solirubrobacterales bacterium]
MDSPSNAGLDEWLILVGIVAVLLFLDLVVMRSRGGVMSPRGAALASVFWIGIALAFGGYVFLTMGTEPGKTYVSGYLIEKSLSLDNVFVFLLVISAFAIPSEQQHRLLTYGIIGALVLRAIFIVVGAAALSAFSWLSIPFAAILIWTGIRLFQHRHDHEGEEKMVQKIKDRLSIVPDHSGKLWLKQNGKRALTASGGALVGIMLVDLLFAVDSVPAILAVTTDTYIVWAANAFALLGLRPLFFLVAILVERLYYLKTALAALLVFVGLKLGAQEFVGKLDPTISLAIIGVILLIGTVASLIRERRLTGHL